MLSVIEIYSSHEDIVEYTYKQNEKINDPSGTY
jgi:hypothetical protein